jgi:hypothetical protein
VLRYHPSKQDFVTSAMIFGSPVFYNNLQLQGVFKPFFVDQPFKQHSPKKPIAQMAQIKLPSIVA